MPGLLEAFVLLRAGHSPNLRYNIPMTETVLAVDIGSTWCKAAWLDSHGQMLAQGRAYTRDIPLGPHSTPNGFWAAFVAAVRQAAARLPASARPAAIGISCRALFGICLDAEGNGFWPAWDMALDRYTNPTILYAYSDEAWGGANPYRYGYTPSFAGIFSWLREHRSEVMKRLVRAGALRDFIVYRMTGAWVTDPATGPNQYIWPEGLRPLSGLPASALPIILDPHCLAGGLTTPASQALGLPTGLPVVVGQHDGAAANLGVGAIRPNDGCFTLGTNFVFRGVMGQHPGTHAMGYWVAPGVWAFVGNIGQATRQFELMTRALGEDGDDISDLHRRLSPLADTVAPGSEGLRLGPLPGDEAEIFGSVRQARRAGYPPGVVYRAILEAVVEAEQRLVNRARQAGAQPTRFVATGGGAVNRAFAQVLASVLNGPVEMGQTEGGILGAGMAAAVGAGWYGSLDAALAGMGTPGPIIQPDPDVVAFYAQEE